MNKYSQAHQRTIRKSQFTSPVCSLDHVDTGRRTINLPAHKQEGPQGLSIWPASLLAVRRRQQICIKVSIVLHTVRRRTHSVILPGRFSKRSYVAAAHRTVAMCFCFCAQLSHRKGSHAVNVCGHKRFFFSFFFQFQDVEGRFRNRAVWKSLSSREPKGGAVWHRGLWSPMGEGACGKLIPCGVNHLYVNWHHRQ